MSVEEKIEILSYYVEPGVRSDRFGDELIRTVKILGYLGSSLTPEFREIPRTTDMGSVYLRSYGLLPSSSPGASGDTPSNVEARRSVKRGFLRRLCAGSGCRRSDMTVDEDLEILSYYLKPGLRSDRFSEDTIQTLKCLGYLGSGLGTEFEEILRTTSLGEVYVRSYGSIGSGDDSGNGDVFFPPRNEGSQPSCKPMAGRSGILGKLLGVRNSGGAA